MIAVLEHARQAAGAGHVDYSRHAREQMAKRQVTARDVRNAIVTATQATETDPPKWKLSGGKDVDGEELAVVVVLSDGRLRVVTTF